MLRLVNDARQTAKTEPASFPFPAITENHNSIQHQPDASEIFSTSGLMGSGQLSPGRPRIGLSTDELLSAINSMSRRMDDLARQLNCFGHFNDDDDDGPRAA